MIWLVRWLALHQSLMTSMSTTIAQRTGTATRIASRDLTTRYVTPLSPQGGGKSSLVHAVRVAAGPVRLGHAVRGRLRPFSFVPRQALAVRGERRRALREASRAGGRVLRRAKSVTRSHALFFGRCDRTATPFWTPAAVKQSKNFCEGFSQPLGARGKPSGSVSSASLLEAIKINRALVDGSNDDVSTAQPHR